MQGIPVPPLQMHYPFYETAKLPTFSRMAGPISIAKQKQNLEVGGHGRVIYEVPATASTGVEKR